MFELQALKWKSVICSAATWQNFVDVKIKVKMSSSSEETQLSNCNRQPMSKWSFNIWHILFRSLNSTIFQWLWRFHLVVLEKISMFCVWLDMTLVRVRLYLLLLHLHKFWHINNNHRCFCRELTCSALFYLKSFSLYFQKPLKHFLFFSKHNFVHSLEM